MALPLPRTWLVSSLIGPPHGKSVSVCSIVLLFCVSWGLVIFVGFLQRFVLFTVLFARQGGTEDKSVCNSNGHSAGDRKALKPAVLLMHGLMQDSESLLCGGRCD